MRYFSTIVLAGLAILFLTLTPAQAEKFKNVDTAKDRQDNVFGTDQRESGTAITVDKDERGATVIRSKSIPKDETDWYDKIDIEVEPQVNWPTDTTTTTTQETVDGATGNTTTTTTTTKTKAD